MYNISLIKQLALTTGHQVALELYAMMGEATSLFLQIQVSHLHVDPIELYFLQFDVLEERIVTLLSECSSQEIDVLSHLAGSYKSILGLQRKVTIPKGELLFALYHLSQKGLIKKVPTVAILGNNNIHLFDYSIAHPEVNFWFTYIQPNKHFLEAGKEAFVKNRIRRHLSSYMGYFFEDFCREVALPLQFREQKFIQYGRYHEYKVEVDIVGITSKNIYLCECKWNNKKVGLPVLLSLQKKAKEILQKNQVPHFILTSKSGFTEEIKNHHLGNVKLITLEKTL